MRSGLSASAALDRLLDTPFFSSMAEVYHLLKGFRAKRQHLSLFASHFPYQALMKLFKVSRNKVHVAKVHAAEIGSDRPPPPASVSFRLPPEHAQYLDAFVDRPEFVQVLLACKGTCKENFAFVK